MRNAPGVEAQRERNERLLSVRGLAQMERQIRSEQGQ